MGFPRMQESDDAPEWAKGDFRWSAFCILVASIAVIVPPLLWLGDRGIGGKVVVLAAVALLIRWLAIALPRFRSDGPSPPTGTTPPDD